MRKVRTHFDILGVTPADDMTTIRMAWRAKVRLLHPDRAKDKGFATEELAEVNAAFDALQGHEPVRSKTSKPARRPKFKRPTAPPEQRTTARKTAPRATPKPAPTVRWRVAEQAMASLCQRAQSGYAEARQNVKAA